MSINEIPAAQALIIEAILPESPSAMLSPLPASSEAIHDVALRVIEESIQNKKCSPETAEKLKNLKTITSENVIELVSEFAKAGFLSADLVEVVKKEFLDNNANKLFDTKSADIAKLIEALSEANFVDHDFFAAFQQTLFEHSGRKLWESSAQSLSIIANGFINAGFKDRDLHSAIRSVQFHKAREENNT